jgi:dTMP kinase
VEGVSAGRFITFEGGEGGGKSTQVRLLVERLRGRGLDVIATREPGGSPGAESLRELLVRGAVDRWSALTETLILYAARRDHIERVIRPALERGAWVLSDRFADSTRAYQGAASGVDPAFIAELERVVLGQTRPDMTLILDLPAAEGLKRAGRPGNDETRFEDKGLLFHDRLRAEFLSIAQREPMRCVVVDARAAPEVVCESIWATLVERFGKDFP